MKKGKVRKCSMTHHGFRGTSRRVPARERRRGGGGGMVWQAWEKAGLGYE